MEWNRKYQVWTSPEQSLKMSIDVIRELIKCDNLPNVHTLGYVPEWICHTQQGQNVSTALDKNRENQILWEMLTGQKQ